MSTFAMAGFGILGVAWLLRRAGRAQATTRARSLAGRAAWRVPGAMRERIGRALLAAGLDLAPEPAVEFWLGGSAVAGVVAFGVAPALAVPTVMGTLAAGPAALRVARGRAARRYAAALPAALETVVAELRGGGTVAGGISALAGGPGALASDLRRVESRMALGLPLAAAIAAWPDERDAVGVRASAGALALAVGVGGRAADALDGLAGSLRDRIAVDAEARALSTQARLSAVVVGAAPIVYLVFSVMVDPGSARSLLGTGAGRVCLVLGLSLEALGVWTIRRIVERVS